MELAGNNMTICHDFVSKWSVSEAFQAVFRRIDTTTARFTLFGKSCFCCCFFLQIHCLVRSSFFLARLVVSRTFPIGIVWNEFGEWASHPSNQNVPFHWTSDKCVSLYGFFLAKRKSMPLFATLRHIFLRLSAHRFGSPGEFRSRKDPRHRKRW